MNTQAVATRDDRMTAIESKIDREISNSISVGTGGITFQNAGEVMEYAKMMAVSGSAVPKHLRGQPGACLGIIDDAIRFHTSPYALARKSFFVNDNLAYEAQVIAGIVNRFAPLRERPDVQYEGEGDDRKCIVVFRFRDGSDRTYESPRFKDIHPKNSPLWKNDPDQQQAYYSLRAGARRHCPEIILGMYDIDEMREAQMRDITPKEEPSVMARLQARQADAPAEGFSTEHVEQQTGELLPETEQNAGSDSPLSTSDSANGEAQHPKTPTSPNEPPEVPLPSGGSPTQADARAAGAKARADGMSLKAMPDAFSDEPLRSAYVDGFESGAAEDREPGADG